MAKITEIVTNINDTIKGVSFTDKRFQKGSFYGITEKIEKAQNEGATEVFPGISDVDGDVTIVSIDDSKSFFIYHVLEGVLPSNYVSEDDFGEAKTVRETYNMRLVFWGDRRRLQLTREQVLTGILSGFPAHPKKTDIASWNLMDAYATLGAANIEKTDVYRQEFATEKLMIKPQHILLSQKYVVVTEFRQGCISLCDQ